MGAAYYYYDIAEGPYLVPNCMTLFFHANTMI